MNQRIQELAEQAHCYACEYAQQPDYNPHNPYNQSMYKQRYDSKFAELIVRECITRIEGCATIPEDDEFVKGYNKGVSKVASQVKHHFGVEE